MSRFINTELKSDSESSDSDSEKVDNKLMTNINLILIMILNKTLLFKNKKY